MLPSYETDASKVPTKSFILGTEVNGLKGLNKRKVLNPEMFAMPGIAVSRLVTTTIKSSQFQASFKYALWPQTNPNAMILANASKVNITVNTISESLTKLFCHMSASGFV